MIAAALPKFPRIEIIRAPAQVINLQERDRQITPSIQVQMMTIRKELRDQLSDALYGKDKITQEPSYSLHESYVFKVQAEEALSQQELETTIRLSQAQAELQEAGNKVVADRMQQRSDADIVRNLSHAKELDRQQYIQILGDIELNEARQFENANRKYEDMRQELANDKANSIHSVETKA